jgi:rRNA biogenesis protein RRP5
MENNNGDSERAETLFEKIVSSLPQRTDVWCVYVDMILKSGNIVNARCVVHVRVFERVFIIIYIFRLIMERATSQRLPPKKMKILYKKWIEIESKYGSEETVERVRQLAKDYVEKAKSM